MLARIMRPLVSLIVCIGTTGSALAQEGELNYRRTEAGVEVTGSITVDGVTYTGAQILNWAEAVAADSSAITNDVPQPLFAQVLEIARLVLEARGTH